MSEKDIYNGRCAYTSLHEKSMHAFIHKIVVRIKIIILYIYTYNVYDLHKSYDVIKIHKVN